jgi:hypothetical protein
MLGEDVEVKAYLDDITVTAKDPMVLIMCVIGSIHRLQKVSE